MSRKRGRKPARQWTRQDRIRDLLGRGILANQTKQEIADDWDVSTGYFDGIWREAKQSLSARRSGCALVSTRGTGWKVTLGSNVLIDYLDDRAKALESERQSVAFQAHQVNDPETSERAREVLAITKSLIAQQPDAVLDDEEVEAA